MTELLIILVYYTLGYLTCMMKLEGGNDD